MYLLTIKYKRLTFCCSQVIELHSQVQQLKWFHIGCDEVFHINTCVKCQARDMTDL